MCTGKNKSSRLSHSIHLTCRLANKLSPDNYHRPACHADMLHDYTIKRRHSVTTTATCLFWGCRSVGQRFRGTQQPLRCHSALHSLIPGKPESRTPITETAIVPCLPADSQRFQLGTPLLQPKECGVLDYADSTHTANGMQCSITRAFSVVISVDMHCGTPSLPLPHCDLL